MHASEPWCCIRVQTPEYYVYEIHANGGHVASIAGWTHFGTICPITEANAQLIGKAPALLRVLRSLVEWNRYTGGWEASCWQQAQDLVGALEEASPTGDASSGPPDPGEGS